MQGLCDRNSKPAITILYHLVSPLAGILKSACPKFDREQGLGPDWAGQDVEDSKLLIHKDFGDPVNRHK